MLTFILTSFKNIFVSRTGSEFMYTNVIISSSLKPYQIFGPDLSPDCLLMFSVMLPPVVIHDQRDQGCILAGISFLSISSILLPTRKSGIRRDKYLSAAIFKEAVHSDDS